MVKVGGGKVGGNKSFPSTFNALSQILKITGHRPEYDGLQKISLQEFHFGTLRIQRHRIQEEPCGHAIFDS